MTFTSTRPTAHRGGPKKRGVRHKKAEVYQKRYDNFRKGLLIETKYIDRSTAKDFDGVTFAFIYVDQGIARAEIIEMLLAERIPFIDVGIGFHQRAPHQHDAGDLLFAGGWGACP